MIMTGRILQHYLLFVEKNKQKAHEYPRQCWHSYAHTKTQARLENAMRLAMKQLEEARVCSNSAKFTA